MSRSDAIVRTTDRVRWGLTGGALLYALHVDALNWWQLALFALLTAAVEGVHYNTKVLARAVRLQSEVHKLMEAHLKRECEDGAGVSRPVITKTEPKVVPHCACGHAQQAHWSLIGRCMREGCQCAKFREV